MAAEYINSLEITNRTATPTLPNEPSSQGPAFAQEKVATVTTVTASNSSVYRFFGVPSNARITSLKLRNDAMSGVISCDFGCANPAVPGVAATVAPTYANATAANQHLFIQSQDIHAVNLAGTDIAFLTTVASNAYKRLWELCGYTTDPGGLIDIVATITSNSAQPTAGNISLFCAYVCPA